MPEHISYQGGTSYQWTGTGRPSAPDNVKALLLDRFVTSDYAKRTTLAEFLNSHPNAFVGGVLNAMHRRHIISWASIKEYARAMATGGTKQIAANGYNIAAHFGLQGDPRLSEAVDEAHGPRRAQLWTDIALRICWLPQNVFVGPSDGNTGTAIDVGTGMSAENRDDILAGAPFKIANDIDAEMDGIIAGILDQPMSRGKRQRRF